MSPCGLKLTDNSRQHVPLSPGLEHSSLAELLCAGGTPHQARPLGGETKQSLVKSKQQGVREHF